MNTSAFVTAIRIKIEENQFKTYFFLFAFCLLTTSISLEKIIGNLLAEKLELERKKEFVKGIEASFEERWKLHMSQIRSYAYWPEVWDYTESQNPRLKPRSSSSFGKIQVGGLGCAGWRQRALLW